MVISPKTRSIFIHIQKTGGSSIERLLRSVDDSIAPPRLGIQRHIGAKDLRATIEPAIWDSYYKFAFVRNPWDRLVSWHRMCMEFGENKFQSYVRATFPEFSDFIRNEESEPLAKTRQNQLDLITDDAGNLLVDFVGRFEDLEGDFRKTGLATAGVKLAHLNKSAHADYRSYYTDETRDIVARRFAKDCEYFGYRFE
jgi:chondroitin 4-sulfotransferase 11